MTNEIKIGGCASDQFTYYLKSLGVFRIVAEQLDENVKAYWRNNIFILQTKFTKAELITFFLEKYKPTPIVSPWNNGSGFYDVDVKFMDPIIKSTEDKMREYRKMIEETKKVIGEIIPEYVDHLETMNKEDKKEINKSIKHIKKLSDEKKPEILRQCRNKLNEKIITWLDTAYIANKQKPSYGPILGSGGNDGRLDISSNFMEWISKLLIKNDSTVYSKRKELLESSLCGKYACLEDSSFAYFNPGRYTSPAGSGDTRKYSVLNPWDYILTIEGTMLFSGSISRRSNSRYAAFPFTTQSSTSGYSTACGEKVRGEVWIPLWNNPVMYPEMKHVFNEGRSQLNTKNVDSGVDFARSVVNMGTERGITNFHRFGMFERKGQAYFAINIGNISTKMKPAVGLLSDLDGWLKQIKGRHQGLKNPPKSMDSLLRQMEDAIIKFCMYGTPKHLQQILVMAGKIEHLTSYSTNYNEKVYPMPQLSSKWIEECYDGTAEYRLAVSLASIHSKTIRINLEQIDDKLQWKPKNPSTVWKKTNLIDNMIAILKRRCLDSQMSESEIQLYSKIPAPLKDVMEFLDGKLDHDKIADLLLGLSAIRYDKPPKYHNERKVWELPECIPEHYTVLKSNFPPITLYDKNQNSLFEPNILGLLKSDRVGEAVQIMRRRLVISGYPISTFSHDNSFALEQPKHKTSQLIASLLFPIQKSDLKRITSQIYAS